MGMKAISGSVGEEGERERESTERKEDREGKRPGGEEGGSVTSGAR